MLAVGWVQNALVTKVGIRFPLAAACASASSCRDGRVRGQVAVASLRREQLNPARAEPASASATRELLCCCACSYCSMGFASQNGPAST
jgi:hypothetical protein